MIVCSPYRHYRLRLMRSLRPSLGATLRAACRRANRLSCRFVSLVFLPPAGTCSLNQSHRYAFGPRIKYGAGSGTHWRHKSARSRFGRPQDARRVCAMEGAHQKSCAIIASTGERCGLSGLLNVPADFGKQRPGISDFLPAKCHNLVRPD